jgi:hypothetical protein
LRTAHEESAVEAAAVEPFQPTLKNGNEGNFVAVFLCQRL